MYILSYITKDEQETLNVESLTASDDKEQKVYSDLLSASCRAVALFIKTNDIPYVDTQATAIRWDMFAA